MYGETPSTYWLSGLADLTDDQCRDGLAAVVKAGRTYPVNLTQFLEACRGTSGSPRFLGAPTSPEELRRLEPPPAKREHVDACLSRMRKSVSESA